MWLKSHRWVTEPRTRYEIRTTMNVRESRHTYMIGERRYQNVDTGKFDTNRIKTISSHSLADIIDNSIADHSSRYWSEEEPEVTYVNDGDRRITIPKFVPRDDDFDDDEPEEEQEEVVTLSVEDELKQLYLELEKKRQQIAEIDRQIAANDLAIVILRKRKQL